MLRNRRFWIGAVLAIVFLFLFLWNTDFSEMRRALSNAEYIYLLPAVLVFLVGVFFRSLRWQYLLRPLGKFSAIRLFPLVVIGFMINNVIPARLGIVARAYILGEKEGVSKMAAGGNLVVEQIFDGITLLLFVAIISLFVSLEGWIQNAVYVAAGLFIGALLLCFILAVSTRFSNLILIILLRILPRRLHSSSEKWFNLLVEGLVILRSPGKLFILLALSMLVWLTEAGTFYVVGFAFDLDQPYYVYILAASVANLAWALLMTQGGVGSFDYALTKALTISAFVPAGVSLAEYEALAKAYTIVLHATLLIPMIALGFIFLWIENVSLARIVQEKEKG